MRISNLVIGAAMLAAACGPVSNEPKFDLEKIPEATSMPTAKAPTAARRLPARIEGFDISPDAGTIALATSGGVVLYDIASGRRLRALVEGEAAGAVAWSPDGGRLAIGSTKDYGTPFFFGGDSDNAHKAHLTVWDTTAWKMVLEPEFGDEMVNRSFADVQWSPDGRAIAFSLDLGGVLVLDAHTGLGLSQQTDFAATVTKIAWSPDSSRLVATHDLAYTLRRWKVSDDLSVRLFDKRVGGSMAVAWSPDGSRIASGHAGGGVCIWTAATNRCDGYIHAHQSATFSLAWSPDGKQLVTGGGVIRIWDTHAGDLVTAFGEQYGITYNALEWPRAGGPLFSLEASFEHPGETRVRMWDPATGQVLMEWDGMAEE